MKKFLKGELHVNFVPCALYQFGLHPRRRGLKGQETEGKQMSWEEAISVMQGRGNDGLR